MRVKFAHTNLIARDWRKLAAFYCDVFGCIPVPPERDLSGPLVDAATGVPGAHLRGMHLRLPGFGDTGPTLEIFQYSPAGPDSVAPIHAPGFAHIAFQVDDVETARRQVHALGGRDYGQLVSLPVAGAGVCTFIYVSDPEGNLIELQSWDTRNAQLDRIFEVFENQGAGQYFGEEVTQLEHALQAATFAQRAGSDDALIAACLLHDFGHLLHDEDENIAAAGIDTRHEALGEAWLAELFPPAVTEPIRLHVAAKRYLCATDPTYLGELSAASLQSLKLQGGPMDAHEIAQFENNPYFREAVQLRRFDDQAKIRDYETPGLEHFRGVLRVLSHA